VALPSDYQSLVREVRRAKDARDKFLGETYWEAIRRYYGPAYRAGETSAIDFENHAHSWISIFLPILASGNPRVRGKTPRMGEAAVFAKAMELAINRNFELTDAKRTIEQLAVSWAFRYAVGYTSPEPIVGMAEREDPPMRPTTKCLSLEDYIFDPLAKQHAECRFQGHRVSRDRESLLKEAAEHPEYGWDERLIETLGFSRARERKMEQAGGGENRDEIDFWAVWIPEIQLEEATDADGNKFEPLRDDGFNGTVFYVSEQSDDFIRPPHPMYGPRDGPYTFSGYLVVPDEVVPLSPLVATAAQAEIYNAVMASAIENIRGYKRGIAVGSDSGNLDEVMADFTDTGIMKIDAISKLSEMMQQVELLGLTPQHQVQLDMLRNLLERSSGISEALQGTTSGSTATEASIASMSVGKRMGFMSEKFIGGMVKPIAKKEGWYLAMHPSSRTSLGELAEGLFIDPKTMQPIEMPILVGGPEHGDLMEDFDVEIQPISMRFTTEMLEAERAASWEQFLLSTAPMIPQTPYIDWQLVYSRKAEQLGDPSLARTIDIQKAMFMGQIQLMAQLGQPAPGVAAQQTSYQPRLGIDVKKPQAPKLKTSEKPGAFSSNARASAATSGQAKKGPRQPGTSATTR